jgi:hypothetical protein
MFYLTCDVISINYKNHYTNTFYMVKGLGKLRQ